MERQPGTCAYCGKRRAVSVDHVPPKNLFPRPRPDNLITVPACRQCHSDACSQDDQYFCLTLTVSEQTGDHPGAREVRENALRSLSRPEATGFRRSFVAGTGHVPALSPAGLFIGMRLAYSVDLSRLFRVVERVVRGLYYHETRHALPEDHDVVVASNETFIDLPVEKLNEYNRTVIEPLAQLPARTIGSRVFWYRYARFQQDDVVLSAWALTFYAGISFLALTGPKSYRHAGAHACPVNLR